MQPHSRDAGFTVIEVAIAGALFAALALGLLATARTAFAAAAGLATRHAGALRIERWAQRVRAEARSAVAIGVTGTGAPCTEVEFYAPDPGGATRFWSYRSAGSTVVRVSSAQPIAPCAATPGTPETVATHVATFTAAAIAAPALAAHADPIGGALDSPFVGSGPPAAVLDTHVAGSPLAAGNTLVEVRLETDADATVVDLVPGILPNGFTRVLEYACGARCREQQTNPALFQTDVDTCTSDGGRIDPAAVTAQAYAWEPCPPPGGASYCLFVTAYSVGGRYTFAYAGRTPNAQPPAQVRSFVVPAWTNGGAVNDPAERFGAAVAAVAPTSAGVVTYFKDRSAQGAAIDAETASCAALAAEPKLENGAGALRVP